MKARKRGITKKTSARSTIRENEEVSALAFYRQHTNSFVIEWILRERFDELPLTRCTDIRGQFVFAIPEINGECNNAR